jgi:hypothetical protein
MGYQLETRIYFRQGWTGSYLSTFGVEPESIVGPTSSHIVTGPGSKNTFRCHLECDILFTLHQDYPFAHLNTKLDFLKI